MTHTHHIVVAVLLSAVVFGSVVWMLAYHGIYLGRRHDRRLSSH